MFTEVVDTYVHQFASIECASSFFGSNCGVGGSTDVLIYQIYKQAFGLNRFETACVYSVFLFIVIFIFTRLQFAFEKRMVHYQ